MYFHFIRQMFDDWLPSEVWFIFFFSFHLSLIWSMIFFVLLLALFFSVFFLIFYLFFSLFFTLVCSFPFPRPSIVYFNYYYFLRFHKKRVLSFSFSLLFLLHLFLIIIIIVVIRIIILISFTIIIFSVLFPSEIYDKMRKIIYIFFIFYYKVEIYLLHFRVYDENAVSDMQCWHWIW